MASAITLEIVTPERQLAHERVDSVQLPGARGQLGILPGHAPLITELGSGMLIYRKGAETQYLSVFRGFAEVLGDRVIVLAEAGERAEEIDVERAGAARDRAQKRLSGPKDPDFDWTRATLALERALIRLQVAGKGGASPQAAEAEHHAAP
jgi:F-type H+-transporting ATPase subunit epsilon